MSPSLQTPEPQAQGWVPFAARPRLLQRFWQDPLLLSALLFSGMLLIYQLIVTLLHPAWGGSITDWLRAALAWPELAVMLMVSGWASKTHQPEARAWWILGVALLSYTVARTLWSVEDQILYPDHAPFPSFPDPFFMLQYPFFFLAVILIPSGQPWGSRVKLILDGLLVMSATTAIAWYFLLAPLYFQSHVSPLGRFINLYYPTADLVILFGLTVTLFYYECHMERIVIAMLIASILCLVTADFWVAWLIATVGFTPGTPPDLFWLAFYLLLPLSGLVWLRLTRYKLTLPEEPRARPRGQPIRRHNLQEVLRFLFPLVAALLACAVIAVRAILKPVQPMSPLGPILVIFGLLGLVTIRQGITVLENAHLRQEREIALANELAEREAKRQTEAFLGIASHELKTPLASIIMGLQLIQRYSQPSAATRLSSAGQQNKQPVGPPGALELVLNQAGRLNRLVNDLLETSRIQAGQMELRFQPVDLVKIVDDALKEQRQLAPERTISLHLPDGKPVPVWADAERIGQVIINYLTNALKYSPEECPVEAGVQMGDQQACVWVRDHGPGISPEERERIWERFHRVPGIEVQSGSGVGLGLGLYISKKIIERHGGQVGVKSVPEQGSTFWFTVPLMKAEPGAPTEGSSH
jgi:signal transduction histidine kinase